MKTIWLGLVLTAGCSKPATINPAWLKEQTAIVDAACSCTNTMKTEEARIPDTNEAYTALLAKTEQCIDGSQVAKALVYKTPSGLEPGVDAEELYNRREVRELETKMNACRAELAERVNMLSPSGRDMLNKAKAKKT